MTQQRKDLSGTLLSGRYRIESRIGGGGMGTVYAALDTTIGKPVAVKVLHPEMMEGDECVARFRQEVLLTSKIGHPNLVDVTDYGHDQGLVYFVMELLPGLSLSAWLSRLGGPMPWPEAVDIVLQVCEVLAIIHEHGVIHRDIKPGNIFLAAGSGRMRTTVKLLDLGIAKVVDEALALCDVVPTTRLSRGVPGTPAYMAPEQLMGLPIDARVDIYALGATLYQMLSGKLLTHAQRLQVESIASVAPGVVVPPAIEAVVLRALARLPSDRHDSVRVLAEALAAASTAEAVAREPATSQFQRNAPPVRRRGALERVLVVLGGGVTAGAVFMVALLFEMPGVQAFARGLRGDLPVTRLPPVSRPFQREPRPSALVVAEAFGVPIEMTYEASDETSSPRTSSSSSSSTPSSPRESKPQTPDERARRWVKQQLRGVAGGCGDPRGKQPIGLAITYDLGTGKVAVRPVVDSRKSRCVQDALQQRRGAALGSGSVTFNVTEQV